MKTARRSSALSDFCFSILVFSVFRSRCRAIALVARAFYGERYFALPMKHNIEHVADSLSVEYSWRRGKKWEFLKMSASGEPQSISPGSHAEFITEHYWGYTCVRDGCSEYRVEHPRWKIWNVSS